MTAKEYLKQYKSICDEIERYEQRIDELRTEAETLSSNTDGMPRGTGVSDKTGRLAVLIADLAMKTIDLRERKWVVRIEIENTINQVGGHEAEVLHKRYIERLRWEEIAREMNYSRQNVLVLHGKALKQIEERLD